MNANDSTTELRAYTTDEVQDELIRCLVHLCRYWVDEKNSYRLPDEPNYYLEGILHSFYVAFAGNSGGFNTSIDICPYVSVEQQKEDFEAGRNSFPTFDTALDINDGTLQYFTYQGFPKERTVVENESDPRVWTEKEMRELLQHEVFRILDDSVATNDKDIVVAGAMMRGILELFENGTESFPKCLLISRSCEEDIDYYKENGENFYALETPLTGVGRSLVELWDQRWRKVDKR